MPPVYIPALEEVYRKAAGLEPDEGDGLFSQFVRAFLEAISQGRNRSQDYAVELIKYAHKQVCKNPSMGKPFPFDE